MRSLRRGGLAIAVGLSFGTMLVAACGFKIDKPGPAGDPMGVPIAMFGDGGDNDTEGGPVLPVDEGGANTCAPFGAGPLVANMAIPGPAPKGMGGGLPIGTYVLTHRNYYSGDSGVSGPTGSRTANTFTFGGFYYKDHDEQWIGDASVPITLRTAGSYHVMDTEFIRFGTCGAGATPVGYTLTGSELHLIAGNDEYVFARQ